MAWLTRIGSLLSAKVWAGLFAFSGLLTALLYARKAGKDAVIAKQAKKAVKIKRESDANRDKIKRLPDPDLDKRLSKYRRQ